MKQTAVEWLEHEVSNLVVTTKEYVMILINQAKEMEKEQIIDAVEDGQRTDFYVKYYDAEQYYNETFKSDQ